MNYLLLKGYEYLTVMLSFFITYVILYLIYKHRKIPQTKGKFLRLAVFIMYIFAVFYFTGIGTLFDLQRFGIQFKSDQINLIPFSKEIDITAYFLNVLLFVPFGFFLPFNWPNTDKLKCTALSGLSFSLLIELSQLFSNRRTDIDDLIMNTLGTLIGYLLYKVYISIPIRTAYPAAHFRYEPFICIAAVYLGHFLMFNEFGAAKILFGEKTGAFLIR